MLKVKNLRKTFGDFVAVENESFELAPGKVLGLIGQNGAGKSTTFKMILNFIEPTQGSITWKRKKIDENILNKIGFLPEERGIDGNSTAEEQILYLAELHGMSREAARDQLDDWFKRLDVRGKRTDKIKKLSKGNQQKIQIISTMIHQPELLILDEPFSGLDPVNTHLLLGEIKRAADAGAAVIFSSHDMGNVTEVSDDLLMLVKGKTVLQGPLNKVRSQFGRTRLYLESPLTKKQLTAYEGVESVRKFESGYQLELADQKVGEQIFKDATKSGYIPAFNQQPPTLDEIFRMKIEEAE